MPLPYDSQFASTTGRSLARGNEAEDLYFQRARSFNPRDAIRETAGGLFDQFQRTAGRRIRDIRASGVGAGRLSGGYGEVDEMEAEFDLGQDLNSRLAGLSLNAEELNLRNTEGLGAYGERATGRGLDLMTAERQRVVDEREARRKRRSGFLGGLAKLAGGTLGTVLGPAGTVIGSRIGSAVASRIGG